MERLDSWKSIAAYLKRDVRTVRRWERHGLPVHRVPGKPRQSVFAYQPEIDAWLVSSKDAVASSGVADAAGRGPRPVVIGAMMALAAVVAALSSFGSFARTTSPARVELTSRGLVAYSADGGEQWQHSFDPAVRVELPGDHDVDPVEPAIDGSDGYLTAVQLRVLPGEHMEGGELALLSSSGALRRQYTVADRLTYADGKTYGAPWGITDFRQQRIGRTMRVALATHHYVWWPSIVAVVDAQFTRRGAFVHAGWLEQVYWQLPDRLVVSGFSESRDGGVVALLDVNALDGQSPEDDGSRFFCLTCGAGRPLRYIVMPRSEVNRASGARFNRAKLQAIGDSIIIHTVEASLNDAESISAVYEFTPDLHLVRASFGDRYWDMHRALEIEGKLDHPRELCPDRNGPREILEWEPLYGWRTTRTDAHP